VKALFIMPNKDIYFDTGISMLLLSVDIVSSGGGDITGALTFVVWAGAMTFSDSETEASVIMSGLGAVGAGIVNSLAT
jgi:hypothetical protein